MTLRNICFLLGPGLLGLLSTASAQTITATTVTAAPNPVLVGTSATLTATVNAPAATGTVTFYAGATVLGSSPVSNGTAVLSTVLLPTGIQVVRARYEGNPSYSPSVSAAFSETVTATASTSFASAVTYPVQMSPYNIAVGDLNKDGNPDLVVPNQASGTFTILLGVGDGTFISPAVTYPGPSLPYQAVIGDFNQDGNPDIAVIDDESTASFIQIYLGNGDGSVQTPAIQIALHGTAQSLAAADLNGDGLLDLAVGTETGVDLLLGDGTGAFPTQTVLAISGTPRQVVAADFRNIGTTDLAIANYATNAIDVFLNNGNGTFAAMQALSVGANPISLAAADLNNDGFMDLVAANSGGSANGAGNVSVILGNGNGTFQLASNLPSTAALDYPYYVVTGDFNGDGLSDLAVSNFGVNTVSIYYGTGNGQFSAAAPLTTGANPVGLAAVNFTRGGALDLAVADSGASNVSIFLGIGTAAPCPVTVTPDPLYVNSVGGAISLTVTPVGASCSYPISTDQPGFVHPGSSSGYGGEMITVTIDPNTTGADRSANLFVGSTTVPITDYFTTEIFEDVPPGTFGFDAINLMSQYGVTNGCSATDYCPAAEVNREEMAIFIVRGVFGGDNFPTPSQTPYFADVPVTTFGFNWIQELYELGVTNGCGAGPGSLPNYCPTDMVTRGAMAKFIILARYGATTPFTTPSTVYFPNDVPPGAAFYSDIERMAEDNITSGCLAGSYCPTADVTRAQMAYFIIRGEYNQLLPPTEPIITSISPSTLAIGGSGTFTITGLNTSFEAGVTQIVTVDGVTASNIVVTSPTSLTATLTSAPGSPAIPVSIYVQTEPQEAVLPNGLNK